MANVPPILTEFVQNVLKNFSFGAIFVSLIVLVVFSIVEKTVLSVERASL